MILITNRITDKAKAEVDIKNDFSFLSVSYTHLDVYKRQVESTGKRNGNILTSFSSVDGIYEISVNIMIQVKLIVCVTPADRVIYVGIGNIYPRIDFVILRLQRLKIYRIISVSYTPLDVYKRQR